MTDSDFLQLEETRQLSQAGFVKAAAKQFGFEEGALSALLQHYDLEPKGLCPAAFEPVDLSMREIARVADLPIKVVGRLQDMKIIGSPISCGDLDFLHQYRLTWRNAFLMKCQLADFSRKQRAELLTRPEFTTKWEKWVYSSYILADIGYGLGKRMIRPERRIPVSRLLEQVQDMFGVPDCYNTRQTILKIRQIAQNDRKKIRAGKSTPIDLLIKRDVTPDDCIDYFPPQC